MPFSLQHEMLAAQQRLHLPQQQFHAISAYQTTLLARHVEQRFVEAGDYLWWWEHWKVRTLAVTFTTRDPERFSLMLPAPHQQIYVIVPTESPTIAFQGSLSAIIKVLWETNGLDEFCLVGSAGDWLMYENHHDLSLFVGFLAMRAVKVYARQYPQAINDMFVTTPHKR